MEQWSQDNILISTASKKGNGINSILNLLQDLISFREKVASTIEAQDISDNEEKLEEYYEKLGQMYESLLEMARGGIGSIRKEPKTEEDTQEDEHLMMNDNLIQKLP